MLMKIIMSVMRILKLVSYCKTLNELQTLRQKIYLIQNVESMP